MKIKQKINNEWITICDMKDVTNVEYFYEAVNIIGVLMLQGKTIKEILDNLKTLK
jgi:hypothetical protein